MEVVNEKSRKRKLHSGDSEYKLDENKRPQPTSQPLPTAITNRYAQQQQQQQANNNSNNNGSTYSYAITDTKLPYQFSTKSCTHVALKTVSQSAATTTTTSTTTTLNAFLVSINE